jgi:hypothetical protein
LITHSDVAAYDRDGVVCLRQAFDAAWVERLRAAVERDLAAPGPHATNFAEGSTPGRFFGDMSCGGTIRSFAPPHSNPPLRPLPPD